MSKQRALRIIDQQAHGNGSIDGEVLVTSAFTGVARTDLISAPSGLTLSAQAVYRSTSTPSIAATFTWRPADGQRFDYFILQVSTDSGFASKDEYRSVEPAATVILKPNTLYYVRVAAAFENFVSQYSTTYSFTTMTDTTVPPNVSSMTLDWSKGDLYITVPISDTDLVKDIRLRIYNPQQSILYDEIYTTAPYLFSAEENRRVTGNSPLTSLRVVADTRSWSNTISASGYGVTTTSPVPSGISGLTTTWNGDTGTASADLLITWNAGNQASSYGVEINNSASQRFETPDSKFVYPYAVNQQNNPPSGLYTLPVRVWGINKISQSGVSTAVTHTNAAPTTAGASVSVLTGFSQIVALLTHAQIEDVREYEWRLIGAATGTTTYKSLTKEITLAVPNEDSYTVAAYIIDKFGRASSAITSSSFYSDTLTLSGLRSSAVYSDSQGTNAAVLAAYKDNTLTGAAVVAHNNTTAGSRWTEMKRELVDRYRSITLAVSGAMRFYVRTSEDNVNFSYFGGPYTGTYGNTLTEYASSALAQTNYATYSGAIQRLDLPTIHEARYIRIYHWTPSATYGMQEFYPRRLVQSDDIEAESIKTINIAAGNVTADKIFVINLAAVNAYTGNLTISGVLSIHANGGIYQGTGSFSSPTTGLKVWNNNGIGRLTTYSGAIAQIDFDTFGRLTAGAGTVILSADGMNIYSSGLYYRAGSIKFNRGWDSLYDPGVLGSEIYMVNGSAYNQLFVKAYKTPTAGLGYISISAEGVSSNFSGIVLSPRTGSANGIASMSADNVYFNGHIIIPDGTYTAPTTGKGLELLYSNSLDKGYIHAYDRTGAAYKSLSIRGLTLFLQDNAGSVTLGSGNAATNLLTIDHATSPQIAFNVSGTAKWTIGPEPGSSNRFIIYNNTNAQYNLIMSENGNSGFGANVAPSASTRLIVRGRTSANTDNALVVQNSSSTNLIIIRDDGAAGSCASVVTWTLISDASTKDNIKDNVRGLKELKQLRTREYELKIDKTGKKYVGFVAQELEQVLPEFVDTVYDDVKGIRTGDLIPLLVNAVQELSSRLEALESAKK